MIIVNGDFLCDYLVVDVYFNKGIDSGGIWVILLYVDCDLVFVCSDILIDF